MIEPSVYSMCLLICSLCSSGLSQHILASSVSLLRASEIEDLITGKDDRYRSSAMQNVVPSEVIAVPK